MFIVLCMIACVCECLLFVFISCCDFMYARLQFVLPTGVINYNIVLPMAPYTDAETCCGDAILCQINMTTCSHT